MKEEKNGKREKAAWITAVLLFLLAAGLTAAGMLFSDPGFDGSEPEALPENESKHRNLRITPAVSMNIQAQRRSMYIKYKVMKECILRIAA